MRMSSSELQQQLVAITAQLAGRTLDVEMQEWLNREYGPGSDAYRELELS